MHLPDTQLLFLFAAKAEKIAVFLKPLFRQQGYFPVRQFKQTVSFHNMFPETDKRESKLPDLYGYAYLEPVGHIRYILFQKDISHIIDIARTGNVQCKMRLQLFSVFMEPFDKRILRNTTGSGKLHISDLHKTITGQPVDTVLLFMPVPLKITDNRLPLFFFQAGITTLHLFPRRKIFIAITETQLQKRAVQNGRCHRQLGHTRAILHHHIEPRSTHRIAHHRRQYDLLQIPAGFGSRHFHKGLFQKRVQSRHLDPFENKQIAPQNQDSRAGA